MPAAATLAYNPFVDAVVEVEGSSCGGDVDDEEDDEVEVEDADIVGGSLSMDSGGCGLVSSSIESAKLVMIKVGSSSCDKVGPAIECRLKGDQSVCKEVVRYTLFWCLIVCLPVICSNFDWIRDLIKRRRGLNRESSSWTQSLRFSGG